MDKFCKEQRGAVQSLRDEAFPEFTDPYSRHLCMMADALAKGEKYFMIDEEPEHVAGSLYATIRNLWELRIEHAKSKNKLGDYRTKWLDACSREQKALDKLGTVEADRKLAMKRIDTLQSQLDRIRALVNEQAEDFRLWHIAEHITEARLQQALRQLHAAIEGKSAEECAREALNNDS